MTLHEVAEGLRKLAYDMDEASRRWDANDEHVAMLNRTIASLTNRIRVADVALVDVNARLARERKRARRRLANRKAKR